MRKSLAAEGESILWVAQGQCKAPARVHEARVLARRAWKTAALVASDYEDPERTAGPDDSAESGFEGDDDVDGASIPAAHCNSAARQDSIVRN
jgi:hypothetical protein